MMGGVVDQVIADVSDDESAEQLSLATLAYSATPAPQVGPTALSPINTEADIAKAAEQAASPLVQIDLTETEAEARQRESNVVTSIWNAELQERANKEHRATVKALADRLLSHGVQPYQSVMDVFAERRATVFIFEVKSIHIDNYVAQTRMALGQLLHYEHTEVRSREVYRGRLDPEGCGL